MCLQMYRREILSYFLLKVSLGREKKERKKNHYFFLPCFFITTFRPSTEYGEGLLVKQSLAHPTLFAMLPQLLPDRMMSLMSSCASSDEWKLQNLETTLQEKPWAFGFSTVRQGFAWKGRGRLRLAVPLYGRHLRKWRTESRD